MLDRALESAFGPAFAAFHGTERGGGGGGSTQSSNNVVTMFDFCRYYVRGHHDREQPNDAFKAENNLVFW